MAPTDLFGEEGECGRPVGRDTLKTQGNKWNCGADDPVLRWLELVLATFDTQTRIVTTSAVVPGRGRQGKAGRCAVDEHSASAGPESRGRAI
jgi:hypothetical protein